MKFITYIIALMFSIQAHAHQDHLLGEGFAHDLMHAVLFFLLVGVTVTGFNWLRKKIKTL